MKRSLKRPGGTRRRGSSLIEVLIAMTILALLMVGVLEMYSLSLVVNAGSAARTQMTFKAQQVVENIRLVYGMYRAWATSKSTTPFTAPAGCNIPIPLTPGDAPADTDYTLPYYEATPSDPAWAFWGPAGANVMEVQNGPYQVRFNIKTDLTEGTIVTVTVEASTASPVTSPGPRYLGSVGNLARGSLTTKRIDYVARILTTAN